MASKLGKKRKGSEQATIEALDRSMAIIEFGMDGKILHANDNYLDMVGYNLEDIIGMHNSILFLPEDCLTDSYQDLWQELRRGEFQVQEHKQLTRQGQKIWVQATYHPLLNEDSAPYRVVQFASDISSSVMRRLEDKAHISSICRVQAILQTDFQGRILEANENFLEMVGYSPEEIQDQQYGFFLTEGFRCADDYSLFLEKLSGGEFQMAEHPFVHKNGEQFWIRTNSSPIVDQNGHIIKIVNMITDVTTEKLKNVDYEKQVNAVSQSQAIVQFDTDGFILSANDCFLKMTGYTRDQVIGQHHSYFVDSAHADTREYFEFWESLRRGEYQMSEYKRIGKRGRIYWIQASYNPITDMNGRVIKVVKFATDITQNIRGQREKDILAQSIMKQLDDILNSAGIEAPAVPSDQEGESYSLSFGGQALINAIFEVSESVAEVARATKEVYSCILSSEKREQEALCLKETVGQMVDRIDSMAAQIIHLPLDSVADPVRIVSEVNKLATEAAAAAYDIASDLESSETAAIDVVGELGTILKALTNVRDLITNTTGRVDEPAKPINCNNKEEAENTADSIHHSMNEIAMATNVASQSMQRMRDILSELNTIH